MRALWTPSMRSWRDSGAIGARAWSAIAVTTISTSSVKLMPKRLIPV